MMTTEEFLASERFRVEAERWRARNPPQVDDEPLKVGDVRTVRDPRDDSDLRMVCVLSAPRDGRVEVALVDLERDFAASSDLILPADSDHCSVPFEIVIDGVLHFVLPQAAFESRVGGVSLDVVTALRRGQPDLLPDSILSGTEIAGHMDIRWKFKWSQELLVRALEHWHTVVRASPSSWHFDGPAFFAALEAEAETGADDAVVTGKSASSELMQQILLLEGKLKSATALPPHLRLQMQELGLFDAGPWVTVAGQSGRLLQDFLVKFLINSKNEWTSSSVAIGPSNIAELVAH